MFKLNQLQFHAGVKQPTFQHAIYENVPGDLLTSPLLEEMTRAMEWKVFPPYDVVKVGRVRAQMRERDVIEQREKEQRLGTQSEPARDSQLMQIDGDATESQEREMERHQGKHKKNRSEEEQKREHEETMRQHQRMVQTKNEQMKNDTRDWEQKKEEKRLERRYQERREHENMYEQQHVSPSTSQTGPPNSPEPSPRRRQAVTPTSTPSRARNYTLRSSVKKQPSSKSKSKKSAPHNINIESVQKHAAALSNIGVSHDMPEASRDESHGVVTPIEGTVFNDPFVMSFEERNGFTPMEPPTFDETAGWSFEQRHGFTPMEPPTYDETAGWSFEQRHGFTPMELPTSDDTAQASFAQQQDFSGLYSGIFEGLDGFFPGEENGAGLGDSRY